MLKKTHFWGKKENKKKEKKEYYKHHVALKQRNNSIKSPANYLINLMLRLNSPYRHTYYFNIQDALH